VYNKYKSTVQLVGSELCVYETVARKMYYIKYPGTVSNMS